MKSYSVLRYVRHIVGREVSISELQHVHSKAHVRNYSPSDDDDHNNNANDNDDEEDENDDPNPRAHKITSIEALLNKPEDDNNISNKRHFYDKQQQQKQINNNDNDGRRKMVCGQIGIGNFFPFFFFVDVLCVTSEKNDPFPYEFKEIFAFCSIFYISW